MTARNKVIGVALAAALATGASPAPALASPAFASAGGDGPEEAGGALASTTASGEALAAQDADVAAARERAAAAQGGLDAAEAAHAQAERDRDAAAARAGAAKGASQAAQAELAAAQADAAAAQAKANSAESDDAAKAAAGAQAAYGEATESQAAAQTAYEDASSAAETARAALKDGAFAFFPAVGAQYCVDEILEAETRLSGGPWTVDAETIHNKTVRGDDEDATSTANMLASVKCMRECNELRAQEGVDELYVTLPNMAIAMWQVNWSLTEKEHSGAWDVGENLAWGTGREGTPFISWYTHEKENYETNNGRETGHYKAIIDPGNKTTGYAIHSSGEWIGKRCHSQVFNSMTWLYNDAPTMTVDEYEELLTGWVDEQNAAVAAEADALSALDAAKQKTAEAQAALDAARDAADVEKAQAQLAEALSALAAAQKKADAAGAEEKAAADALAAADTADEERAVADAQAELDAASAALEKAEAPYSFTDVDYSLYYGPTVAAAAKDGLMSGYSGSTNFGPEDVMTRGQLATVLWRAACPDEAAAYDEAGAANETGMGDVEGGKYYTAAANWAVSAGVINGFEVDGHREFRPDEAVTMEQFACIMANLAGAAEGYDASGLGARYVDATSISTWAASSVAYDGDQGWFSGYENPDGTRELKPYEALSRGRAATMLMNMGVK